ncbi:ERF family protein [Lactobacillus crispatus]|uniref:Single-stranded DNA-binding protein n=1 Tax=Lactobacillus crispatus TaxID=47770 RepID=A0A7H9EAD0_9LACO|nr:ERF family protein [Lactobacillus crispatus]QLL74367.1 hypothetical protein GTO85_08400 [Lactobacillus crispatus]
MTEEKKLKDEKETQVPIITQIQNELKAPKTQWNDFGHYSYRNAEDIESAVKPLLEKYGAQLTFDEDYRQVGNRVYCVETAHYKDSEQKIIVHGWARESESKKGMDDSQISGSASSYATKYALGKLFLIDDTKDADSQKPTNAVTRQSAQKKPRETLGQRIAKAKQFEVQYGGGKEKLVDVCKWEEQGDQQAKAFLDNWRTKSKGNEAAYNFIKDQGLQKESA